MAGAVKALLDAPEQGMPGHPGYSKVLMVEAETGIGKSLAYLVPAILSGKRVVVSTATINLQDQLIEKEIPLVADIIGEDIRAVCVKGRQNYLCHYRWFQYRSSPQLSLVEDEQAEKIEQWLQSTDTGDRAELEWLPDRSPLWPKISAHSHQCLGGDCPEASLCFVNSLRKKAGSARILIVNHHLYFSDLALRRGGYGELLPRHEAVIFDEAHHLEQVATSFFGRSISQYQIYDLIGDIAQNAEAELEPEEADRLIGKCGGLRQRTERFAALFPGRRGRYNLTEFAETVENWPEEVNLLADGLRRLAEEAAIFSSRSESFRVLEERAGELRANLLFTGLYDSADMFGSHVFWYERRERAISLSATPVNVSEDLRNSLYSMVPACVLTSATLSSGGSFDYIRNRLGLDGEIEILQLKSPFDYRRRAAIYIPEDSFPEPSAAGFEDLLCERIEKMVRISRGRALVLFTSFKGMDCVAEYLQERLEYPILVQGAASRSRLLDLFRKQTASVLLAVASFWEGVDVPGDALCCVIIDKLPFEVPSDPVVQARMEAITNNGGNPFFEFQVPRAVLSLRQGVGRLMRSAQDYGLICIMDVRLFSKRYGNVFLKSMPPSKVLRDIRDAEIFFEALDQAN